MYDYYLGGSHNFAVDREAAQQAMRHMPELPYVLRENRSFLRRAVRFLVGAGVRQFLDLGSGIPTVGNVHEVVHRLSPGAKVVYVDVDPVAVAHSAAILAGDERAAVIQADVRRTEEVLDHPDLRRTIDLDEPVGVLLVAVLHFIDDEDDPAGIVARLRDAVVPGSQIAISHASREGQPPAGMESAEAVYARTSTPMVMRSRTQVADLFTGLELADPGVVQLPLWRPEADDTPDSRAKRFPGFGGVGRKAAGHPT